MEKTLSEPTFQSNYSHRARGIKTRAQARNEQARIHQIEADKGGLTKRQYWQLKVRTKEDIVRFYSIYHPEYPDFLAKALADKFEDVLLKYNNGAQLTDEEAKLLGPLNAPQDANDLKQWDFREDLQQQMLEGKIKLAEARLEKLMEEEDEVEKK